MSNVRYQYPLDFLFKVTTIANDFTAADASGKTIFFVREEFLKLRDHVKVYADESKEELLYEIISNKIIDFQQTFTITNNQNIIIGKVRKKTLKSFVKATYYLQDSEGNQVYTITERSFASRFLNTIFEELLPMIGEFSGYVFNPKYVVKDKDNNELLEMIKERSLLGRKFTVKRLSTNAFNEERVLLSLILMIIQQRRRS